MFTFIEKLKLPSNNRYATKWMVQRVQDGRTVGRVQRLYKDVSGYFTLSSSPRYTRQEFTSQVPA